MAKASHEGAATPLYGMCTGCCGNHGPDEVAAEDCTEIGADCGVWPECEAIWGRNKVKQGLVVRVSALVTFS